MDEKKLHDEELEDVSGGGTISVGTFGALFTSKNCCRCMRVLDNSCPYGGATAKYEAFNGDPNAVCPDKTP